MQWNRRIYGIVTSTNEVIAIDDWRKVIEGKLGDKAYLITADDLKREVRVKDERRVDVEALKGDWEVEDNGKWLPISSLSPEPPTK